MAQHDRWYSNPTQVFWCCKALLENRTISHKTEIREVNGWRLAAIVEKLRKQYAWPIDAEYRGKENTAYYRLRSGTDPRALRYPPSAQALAEGVTQW